MDGRIFISVTGHMDISPDTERRIGDEFRAFLEDLTEGHPGTELFLLSGRAEGSDITAAETFLGTENANAHLIPVLTDGVMERRERNGPFRDRFDRIMKDDRTLEPYFIHRGDANQYVQLSRYMIRNSDVMVAFWDGRLYRNSGGTFDTVRMAVQGLSVRDTVENRFYEHPTGSTKRIPVYWILTERTSSDQELALKGCSGERVDLPGNIMLIPGRKSADKELSAGIEMLSKELECHFSDRDEY